MRQSRFSKWTVAALAVALMVTAAVPAAAETEGEPTREQYVERAEPICERNVQANKRIFRGAKGEVRRGQLKKASRHFFQASRAFGRTIRQLARVPRPAADAARLKKWFGLLRKEKNLIAKIGRALRAEKKKRAESVSLELNRNSNRANNTVLPLGFDYCRLEQSRFG